MCIRDRSQAVLQAQGITPLLGNLDAPASLRRLAGLAPYVPVSYTHLRAHETVLDLVCRLLLEKKNK